MKQIWSVIQVAFAALGGVFGWFMGGLDGFLYALIAFVAVDYITGVLSAIERGTLSSTVGFKGIARKVLIFTLVGIGNIIDTTILKSGTAIRTAVIFFYLSNEGLSIMENAARVGLPIPEKLRVVFTELRREDRKNG